MAKRNNSKVRVKRRSKASMTRNTRRNTIRNTRRNTRRRNSIKRTKRKSNKILRNRNKNLYHGGMLRGMRSGWDQLPNLGVGETLFGQGSDYVDQDRVLALSSGSNSSSGSQPTAGYDALQGQCLPQDNYIPNVGPPIQRPTPPPPIQRPDPSPILRPRRKSVKNTAPDPLPRPRSRSQSRPRPRSQSRSRSRSRSRSQSRPRSRSRHRRMSLTMPGSEISVMNPLAMNFSETPSLSPPSSPVGNFSRQSREQPMIINGITLHDIPDMEFGELLKLALTMNYSLPQIDEIVHREGGNMENTLKKILIDEWVERETSGWDWTVDDRKCEGPGQVVTHRNAPSEPYHPSFAERVWDSDTVTDAFEYLGDGAEMASDAAGTLGRRMKPLLNPVWREMTNRQQYDDFRKLAQTGPNANRFVRDDSDEEDIVVVNTNLNAEVAPPPSAQCLAADPPQFAAADPPQFAAADPPQFAAPSQSTKKKLRTTYNYLKDERSKKNKTKKAENAAKKVAKEEKKAASGKKSRPRKDAKGST